MFGKINFCLVRLGGWIDIYPKYKKVWRNQWNPIYVIIFRDWSSSRDRRPSILMVATHVYFRSTGWHYSGSVDQGVKWLVYFVRRPKTHAQSFQNVSCRYAAMTGYTLFCTYLTMVCGVLISVLLARHKDWHQCDRSFQQHGVCTNQAVAE